MIEHISALTATGVALTMGAVIGGFWIAIRVPQRLKRRRKILRQADPCRRCGARN